MRPRSGPPVGRAFVVFTAVELAFVSLAASELVGLVDVATEVARNLGVMASTTFVIASILAAYRAVASQKPWAAAVAVVLMGPGAAWSWSTFVLGHETGPAISTLVVVASSGLAIVLLVKGLRTARWFEVFAGLGAFGLGMAAVVVRLDPGAGPGAGGAALLVAMAGMTCLYGLLVDLEMAEYRSMVELIESRRRIESEVTRVEDLLHDLRNGLLAIESAIGSVDGELVGPLRSEAARLRRLTVTGERQVAVFDLGDQVRDLVAARKGAGLNVVLLAPDEVTAWGEESEVLAVVDNLLTNAERHGRSAPIVVELAAGDGTTRLSVTNEGQLPMVDPESLFERGVTTHPAGTGVGLTRARMLASLNGADLRVGPALAGYTTFVLTLRAQPPSAVAS